MIGTFQVGLAVTSCGTAKVVDRDGRTLSGEFGVKFEVVEAGKGGDIVGDERGEDQVIPADPEQSAC